ncbi:MAG: hypothetical protein A2Y28_03140 [Chlamydiae bacterium GWC2_50_10]|nr:MAG: hypothetical protein A2Z85_01580 [Chlamydiae bacterium GWA2_50_15]OGN54256.1 MAG: hypothetical protein A2Y28_03140 [Chlamydiae bacterium GWC2_50_10]OGN54389.1 MAG: hypothetical protein A2098_02075 [Chlamydiae bacterium GWF2_49_8]OGN58778.1 MAG: hypothetical protein A3D18_06130 [Chlamydiae bacterium RIFCSPHIGHO2_02_FULL_49_29]OGN63244.1 MAG: hypothetical protein A3E26_04920 [Chlamydiae bacterium RIFCSPHIGHO2_12_FULL_49_32]OGN68386.1 MAG: hypothetical protein A3I15_04370 [Chlamydiae bact
MYQMINPIDLEKEYHKFSQDLQKWSPDGVIPVNLSLLHEIGILKEGQKETSEDDDTLSHYFHVIETEEKVTLFNEQFVIWITPRVIDDLTSTLTLIALLHNEKPRLEVVFSSSGVYNSPKYILKVLQHYLQEMIDTEKLLSSIEDKEG